MFNQASNRSCEVCGTLKGSGAPGTAGGGGGDVGDVYLEFTEGSSNKFWKLKLLGCTTMVTYGPIGKVSHCILYILYSYISVAYIRHYLAHTCEEEEARKRGSEEARKRGRETAETAERYE